MFTLLFSLFMAASSGGFGDIEPLQPQASPGDMQFADDNADRSLRLVDCGSDRDDC